MPGLETVSMRAQLACLPTYFKDGARAGQVAYTWSALSKACHHHTYEIAPTEAELRGWIEVVASLTVWKYASGAPQSTEHSLMRTRVRNVWWQLTLSSVASSKRMSSNPAPPRWL